MKRVLKSVGITACFIIAAAATTLAGGRSVVAEDTGSVAELTDNQVAESTKEQEAAPTAEATVAPTAEATVAPTAEATAAPTAEATVAPTAAPDIKLGKKSFKLFRGQSFELKLEGLLEADKIKWSSSDAGIVSVNKKGHIRGIAEGKATVKAEVNSAVYKCNVTVKNSGIDYASYVMEEGEMLRLHIDGADKVKWTSSNKKIAKVTDGRVTAVKKGKAVIKAVTSECTYTCEVVVSKKAKGVIYLTFDDGPTTSSTPKILDILKKNDVHATFFTIGMDSTKAELIKREAKEGHAIAIHGAIHDYNKIYASEKAYMNNILTQQKNLKKLLGYNVWITRFPGGSSNLVSRNYNRGIMSRLVKTVNNAGFAYFDWNVSSNDAGGAVNSDQVYKSVIRGLSKSRDNVVLMHDFANNSKTIGALDRIIKYGKSHGYEFRKISASTTEVHHGVQN